jgi:hypothetical protein
VHAHYYRAGEPYAGVSLAHAAAPAKLSLHSALPPLTLLLQVHFTVLLSPFGDCHALPHPYHAVTVCLLAAGTAAIFLLYLNSCPARLIYS